MGVIFAYILVPFERRLPLTTLSETCIAHVLTKEATSSPSVPCTPYHQQIHLLQAIQPSAERYRNSFVNTVMMDPTALA